MLIAYRKCLQLFFCLFLCAHFLVSYGQSPAAVPCTDEKYFYFNNYGNAGVATKFFDLDRNSDGGVYVTGVYQYRQYGIVAKLTSQGDTIWVRTYGESQSSQFRVITATRDGGFLAVGYNYRKSNGNIWLLKGDANGNQVWSADLNDASSHKMPTEVLELADGSFVITGITNNNYSGNEQAAVWKVNASGQLLWAKKLSDNFSTRASGVAVAGGDLLISGLQTFKNDYSSGGNKGMIFRIRSGDGELVWNKTYSSGSRADEFFDINEIRTNEYLVTAKLNHNVTDATGNYGYVKINGDGDVIDHATLEGGHSFYNEKASVIRPAPGGGYIGVQRLPEPNKVLFFKLEEDNTITWNKIYHIYEPQNFLRIHIEAGGEIMGIGSQTHIQMDYTAAVYRLDNNGNAGNCIATTSNPVVNRFANITVADFAATIGNMQIDYTAVQEPFKSVELEIAVSCSSPSCKTLANIDSDSCSNSFMKNYGGDGSDEALDVQNTTDNGNILCGRTTSGSAGDFDGFMMKISNDGSMLWSRTIGGTGFDELRKIKLTSDQHFIAIGTSRSADNIDKVWIVKTDAVGNQVWSKTFLPANGKSSYGKDIIELADGNFAFTAVLNDSLTDSDGWLVKIDIAGNVGWSTIIDEGKADGLKGLVEKAGYIYTSGFITRTNKDMLLAKFDAADGTASWLRTYRQLSGDVNEAGEECYITNGELSCLAIYYTGDKWGVDIKQVTRLYFDDNGNVTNESNAFYSAVFPDLAAVDLAPNNEGEMITSVSLHVGTTFQSNLAKAYHENHFIWRRYVYMPLNLAINSSSFLKDGSSLFVGKDAYAVLKNNRPSIAILKVNPRGGTGNCMIEDPADYRHIVFDLSKKTTGIGPVVNNGVAFLSLVTTGNMAFTNINSPFVLMTFCTSSDCRIPDAVLDECNSAHRTNYETDYSTTINTVAPLPDGSLLAMGNNRYKTYNRSTLKIAANGKLVSYNNSGSDTTEKTTLFNGILPDGSLVSIGTHIQGFIAHGFPHQGIELSKWDHQGNVVNNKIYLFEEIDRINSFIAASDGFIYVAASNVSGYIFPHYGVYFLKFDANLDLVWSKKLYFNQSMSFMTAMTLHKEHLILAGGVRYSGTDGWFHIIKLEAATGNLLLKTSWNVLAENLVAKEVYVQNDTVLVTALMNTSNAGYESDLQTKPTLLKFDLQGKFLSGFRFTGYNGLNQYYSPEIDLDNCFTRTDDGKLVFATQGYKVRNTLGIITWKFDTDGKLDWGWQYPQTSGYTPNHVTHQGNHIYIAGDQPSGKKNEYQDVRFPFIMKLNQTGLITETLGTDCSATPITPGIETMIIVPQVAVSQDDYSDIRPMLVYNLVESDRRQYMKTNPACTEPALCNTLSLSAPAKICSLSDTVMIMVTKEKGCNAPLIWQVLPEEAELLEANDFYAKLVFKKPGSITLTAHILVGCKIISANSTIEVSDQNKALNLGPATEICAGTNITLKAGLGYKDYMWQDGITTDPVFIADKPGVYSVTVMDFCGKSQTASVNISAAPPVLFNLGKDTSFCIGDSITLRAPGKMMQYAWGGTAGFTQLNDSTIRVSPAVNAGYWATIERSAGCIGTDRIELSTMPLPIVNLGNDTTLCQNQPLLIDAGNPGFSFAWNTDGNSQTIRPVKSGTYSVSVVSPDGCRSVDVINVVFRPLPILNLGKDRAICENTALVLDAAGSPNAGNAGYRVNWNDGSSGRAITVSQPGKYWATVSDNYDCSVSDTLIITHTAKNPANFLPDTMIICNGWNTAIKSAGSFSDYQWSTGSRQQHATVKDAGTYVLAVTDANGCVGSDTVMISGKQCLAGVFVPNAFTPNNDGKHDKIKPLIFGEISGYRFSIFNRWGEKVFDTNDPEKGWDGRINGIVQGNDSYVYVMIATMKNGTPINQKGNITLVR